MSIEIKEMTIKTQILSDLNSDYDLKSQLDELEKRVIIKVLDKIDFSLRTNILKFDER